MSLIDDLKAAHEAASAQLPEADFHSAGWHRRNAAIERRDTLMREHAGEIIAALDAARYYRVEWESGDCHLDTSYALWQDVCAALDALEGKG